MTYRLYIQTQTGRSVTNSNTLTTELLKKGNIMAITISQTLEEQLKQWQQRNQPTTPSTPTKSATQLQRVQGHIGKARKLHPYVAVVKFPVSRGGGTLWYKSKATVDKLIAQQAGFKVEWLR